MGWGMGNQENCKVGFLGEAEELEPSGWTPGDVIGSGSERLVRRVTAAQHGDCGAIEDCQAVG